MTDFAVKISVIILIKRKLNDTFPALAALFPAEAGIPNIVESGWRDRKPDTCTATRATEWTRLSPTRLYPDGHILVFSGTGAYAGTTMS
jgi:hypothetical protein